MLLLKCQECGRTFTYPHQLRRHRRVHTMMNRTMYRCKVCNTTFSYLSSLRQHLTSHFSHTSGDNQYMDDLAIGVTIEPVHETACRTAGTRCHCGQGVTPCYCQRGLVVGHSQSGLGCGERCLGHRTSPCCCESRPVARCRSVMLIDPRQVVHVDMTHDPSLSYPVCEVPLSGSVVPENVCPGDVVSGTVIPESVVPESMVPESVIPESVIPESVKIPESMVPGNAVHGSAISVEDQDRCGRSFQKEHTEEDVAEEHYADDESDVGWMFPPAEHGDNPPAEHGDKSNCPDEPGQDIAAADGSVRPVMSQDYVFSVNDVKLPVSSEVLDSVPGAAVAEDGISGFDDMATCHDLSNFFPDFIEKSEPKPTADSKPGNTSNNRNSLVYEEDARRPLATGLGSVCPTSPRGVGHRTDLSSSDLEACVKLGLDSTALNPTVVVNDLQREIARLQRAVGGEDKEEDSYCDLCDVRFNNNKLLLKHARLHRGLLGKEQGITLEFENGNLDSGYTPQPPSRRQPRPKNKMKDDMLMKCVEKVGKTFPNRKPGPKFRVTVSKVNIKCYICGRRYATKQYFIAHAKRHLKKLGYGQTKQDLFYCTICYAFYPCEDKLREHLVDIHSNDEVTTQLTRKRKHAPRANVKGRTGIQANMTTDSDFAESTTDQLVFPELESDVEGGIQPEVASTDQCYGICHVCGTPFSSETGLSEHISSCRGGRPREPPRIPEPVAPKQNTGKKIGFKCHICERIFPAVKNLKNHFVSHDPRRTRLMCPITNCPGNYVWKQNFKRHLLAHATPRGQTFHKVMFNVHEEVFCPFCKRMMFFVNLEEYKVHMLVHVNKIMAAECERNDVTYRVKLITSKEAVVNRPKSPMQSELSTKPEHEHGVGSLTMASATLPTDDPTRKQPFPAAQSSTPNSCFGFADAVSNDVYSGDVSPGGSLQGNSGLFISPVWAPPAENRIQPKGVYSQVAAPQPQRPPPSHPSGPSGQDSKSQLPTDLNDSGFTQMLSGDSDHGEVSRELTPQQGLPSFDSFSRNTRDPRRAASTTAPDRNVQNEDVQRCVPNTGSVFHKHEEDRSSYSLKVGRPAHGLKERPAYYLKGRPAHGHKAGRPAYGLKEDQKAYGLKEHRQAYGIKEDRKAYGLDEDRSSYGLNEDMPAYSRNEDTSSYGLEEDKPDYVIGYFPKMRGKCTTSIFMTQERAGQLMKTSSAITANFMSKGLFCSICGKVKLDMDNVKTHLLSHFEASGKFPFNMKQRGRQFICPLCFKVMLCRRSTTAHMFAHWGLNLIKCPVCYKIFNLVKTLNNHVHKAHPDYRYK